MGQELVSRKNFLFVKEKKKESRNSFPWSGFRLQHEKLMCLFIYDFSPTTKANTQKRVQTLVRWERRISQSLAFAPSSAAIVQRRNFAN